MEPQPATLHQFNLHLPPQLKAEADAHSAALGMSQARFVEWATRLLVQQAESQGGYLFPPGNPRILLARLRNKFPTQTTNKYNT